MLEGITDSRDDSGTVIGKLIYGLFFKRERSAREGVPLIT